MIFLDTHVLVWLYGGALAKFSPKAIKMIEKNELYISPMVELELNFLYEIKRLSVDGVEIVRELDSHLGLTVYRVDFYKVVESAHKLDWTRDPFDRLIVANASMLQAQLITKDEQIREHYSLAIW